MMKVLFFVVILLQTIARSKAGICELVPSTSNEIIDTMECTGDFRETADFSDQLPKISEPVSVIRLKDVSLDTIPPDWLKNDSSSKISTVIIDHSHIKLLSVPELGESPFKPIQSTMESFEIYESEGVFAWNWTVLPVMIQLHTLIIYQSKMIYISDEFYFSPNLFHLQVAESEVKYLHSKSFSRLLHLRLLSLAGNAIDNVERSMFSKPASYLWSLDLSHNLLEKLPNDIFSEMPSLGEIKLEGNRLVTFSPVKPVWKQLKQLWLQGNKFICHYADMCWKDRENEPLFFSSTICQERFNSEKIYVSELCDKLRLK